MKVVRTTALLIALTIVPAAAHAQSCPTACQPGSNGKQGPTSSTVSIGFAAGFSAADLTAFKDGIEMWNDTFLQTWTDMWFTTSATGAAQIIIAPDPNVGAGAVNQTDTHGYGTILVGTTYLNQNKHDFWAHVIAHELGHSLGYSNNFGSFSGGSCASRTLMYGSISPSGPFLSSIPSCDRTALSEDYPTNPPPPPPPDEIQNCTEATGCGSPIILDLGDDAYRFTSIENGVQFALRNGRPRQMAWTRAGVENAFLACDRNGNGRIDNGAELFGNFTALRSGQLARNGFEALSELDDHGDGIIDSNDAAWSFLLLWTDRNHDGVSTADELQSISESLVTALETEHRWVGRKDQQGNEFRYLSHFRLQRGAAEARRSYYDVFFLME